VLDELKGVYARGGRILELDMAAPEGAARASLLNRMENLRDPSHIRAMSVTRLLSGARE
jgi:hypothetical protein